MILYYHGLTRLVSVMMPKAMLMDRIASLHSLQLVIQDQLVIYSLRDKQTETQKTQNTHKFFGKQSV